MSEKKRQAEELASKVAEQGDSVAQVNHLDLLLRDAEAEKKRLAREAEMHVAEIARLKTLNSGVLAEIAHVRKSVPLQQSAGETQALRLEKEL